MEKVTIEDVAKDAGVSITTVSRVINNVRTVKEANVAQVQAAIKRLNFQPNPTAQRLASGRLNAIALIMPRFKGMFHSFYITQIIEGVGVGADRLKLDLLLHITNGKSFINPASVDGIIFADIHQNEEELDTVMGKGIPCVVMNTYIEELPVSCIAIDNTGGAKEAVNYLLELGHTDIATITGELGIQAGIDRLDGYISALKKKGITPKKEYIQYGDFGPDSAKEPAKNLLSMKDRPTAIFCASDMMATTVVDTAFNMGLRVPEDLSVVGFDDSPLASHGRVPLTSIRQPLSEMGTLSVETLHRLIKRNQKSPIKKLLSTKLIERASCRKTRIEI